VAQLRRRTTAISVAAFAAVVFVTPGFITPAKADTKVVVIEGMKFVPATLTVHRGDTVVWRNKDFFPHNATASQGGFRSGDLAPDASWQYKADHAGRFAYICTLHPSMKATLIVQ
jgi:plastocyanin